MLRLTPSAVAAAATTGAAALGVLAARGRVPGSARWCHHALYLVSIVATGLALPASCRSNRTPMAVASLALLVGLPRTRPGSRRHALVGASAVVGVALMGMGGRADPA